MGKLIELYWQVFSDLLPQKFNKWIHNQKKVVRYILMLLIEIVSLIIFVFYIEFLFKAAVWIVEKILGLPS